MLMFYQLAKTWAKLVINHVEAVLVTRSQSSLLHNRGVNIEVVA